MDAAAQPPIVTAYPGRSVTRLVGGLTDVVG
ncbi:MAG: hypothetical protein J07HX64_02348 [halophilic archaeon J07HX64]|nr:MAG: hypothetical protein J07HX64_02348 [halophilic archaeon J07HX64]